MSLKKVVDYIKKRRKEGAEEKQIKNELLEVGWTSSQLEDAFNSLNTNKDKAPKTTLKQRSNPKTNKKVVLVSGLILLLSAIGVFGYFFGEINLFNRLSPEEELISAFKNMENLDSLSITNTFDMDVEGKNPNEDISGNFSLTNNADKKNEEMEAILKGSITAQGMGGEFEGRTLLVNDKLFFRLDKFPNISMFLPFPIDMNDFLGKNILITENLSKEVEEIKDGEGEEMLTNRDLSSEGVEFFKEIFNDDVDQQVIKDFSKDVMDGILEKDIVFIAETDKDQIDGVKVSRNSIEFNLDLLPELIDEVVVEYEDYLDKEVVDEIPAGMNEFEKNLTEAEEEFGEKFYNRFLTVQVWNDKDYIYKAEFTIDEIEEYNDEIEDSEIIITIKASDFNQPLNLQEPEEYTHIDKLMEEIFSSTRNSAFSSTGNLAKNSAYDTQIKSELSQISSNAQQYYYDNKGSYDGFDSSTGWGKLSTEIPDCTGLDSYQIKVSDQKFISWSPLCSEDGFYCVDLEGNSGVYQQKVGDGYSCDAIFK